MSKKESHKKDLTALFDTVLNVDAEEKISAYMLKHSNLPGRRANLELVGAFIDAIAEKVSSQEAEKLWNFCYRLTEISAEEAPVNSPKEFLPFCGTSGLGALGAAHAKFTLDALLRLHTLAMDSRWRMREAVRIAIQRLLTVQNPTTQEELERWVKNGNWLVLRAVAASVAEPKLLKDEEFAKWALDLHKKILHKILLSSDRSSEEFKTVRKGLGYTLSVVIKANPIDGFRYLQQLAIEQDTDIKWIINQNLKKKRLWANYPQEVEVIRKTLTQ